MSSLDFHLERKIEFGFSRHFSFTFSVFPSFIGFLRDSINSNIVETALVLEVFRLVTMEIYLCLDFSQLFSIWNHTVLFNEDSFVLNIKNISTMIVTKV